MGTNSHNKSFQRSINYHKNCRMENTLDNSTSKADKAQNNCNANGGKAIDRWIVLRKKML